MSCIRLFHKTHQNQIRQALHYIQLLLMSETIYSRKTEGWIQPLWLGNELLYFQLLERGSQYWIQLLQNPFEDHLEPTSKYFENHPSTPFIKRKFYLKQMEKMLLLCSTGSTVGQNSIKKLEMLLLCRLKCMNILIIYHMMYVTYDPPNV